MTEEKRTIEKIIREKIKLLDNEENPEATEKLDREIVALETALFLMN